MFNDNEMLKGWEELRAPDGTIFMINRLDCRAISKTEHTTKAGPIFACYEQGHGTPWIAGEITFNIVGWVISFDDAARWMRKEAPIVMTPADGAEWRDE